MLRNPNYVYGPRDVEIPMRINFGEFFINKCMQFKEEIAVINESTGASITYRELTQKAMNLAVSLTRIGVRQGDVVAVCSENRLELWSTIAGITCAGAVMTPINPGYSQGELIHVLKISKPSYIIASPVCYETHQKTFRFQESLKKIIIFGDERIPNTVLFAELVKEDVKAEDFEVPDVRGQTETLFIMYSSGTTGLQKGVMVTHLGVITTILLPPLQEIPQFRNSSAISVMPWFHAMGLVSYLCNLVSGVTVVNLAGFNVDLYMKTVEKYKPTRLMAVPPMLVAFVKSNVQYDMSSVKFITSGAAPLSQDIMPALKAKFPSLIAILQGYGMTESTLAISMDFNDGRSIKPGSVGAVVSGCVVKIVDLNSRKPLGVREEGEICIKSATLMKGYINKDMTDDFDEEGFFRTGDLGYHDEDGHLYIVDRLKELIKYKGHQVPPVEIEAVLLQHPAVRDAGVVGVPHAAGGEAPLAFVVAQPGRAVSETELQDFVAQRLSNPKHLRGGVRFITNIPKNASGKILRRELRLMINKEKSKL